MGGTFPHEGTDKTQLLVIDGFTRWSTRTFPQNLGDSELYVADNAVWNRDGVISKRPGNAYYGSARTPAQGYAALPGPVQAMTRFYPVGMAPQLLVESGGALYVGNDASGTYVAPSVQPFSRASYVTFEQVYDPDARAVTAGGPAGATVCIMCDGTTVPQLYDGVNPPYPVQTGTSGGVLYLPNGRTGAPITPSYVFNWRYTLTYAGERTEPTAVYFSDALRPERFSGQGIVDSAGTPYTAYFPAGRDGRYGVVTGLEAVGDALLIFFTRGIAIARNTGTYGSFQFEFEMISTTTGCPAPRSIVGFGGFVVFFGGDRFYATDGQTVQPLGDDIPSVYSSTSPSAFPSELRNITTMAGTRRSGQYWCAYDNVGLGFNTAVLVFDLQANGGFAYGTGGGAWTRWPSGMPMSCAIECRGPGDTYQLFWGSSGAFTFGGAPAGYVAQFDGGVGGYADFGAPISFEARAKSFMLDRPVWPKTVQGLYVVAASLQPQGTAAATFASTVTTYCLLDGAISVAPSATFGQPRAATSYDTGTAYDAGATYDAGDQTVTAIVKTYPQQENRCNVSFQPGVIETSTNPFNLLALVADVTTDEPFP